MTPEDLLTEARRLVERPDAGTAGVWPRAAALLARQALEQAMAGLWAGQPGAEGLSGGTMRSQLLCLTAYVDQDVATRAAYLSAARVWQRDDSPDMGRTMATLDQRLSRIERWLMPLRPPRAHETPATA